MSKLIHDATGYCTQFKLVISLALFYCSFLPYHELVSAAVRELIKVKVNFVGRIKSESRGGCNHHGTGGTIYFAIWKMAKVFDQRSRTCALTHSLSIVFHSVTSE